MGLSEYRKKRQFCRTPEPNGSNSGGQQENPNQLRFVVQKHAARNLHYDLRLELDGVLLSWAVPKGPSLDPSQKRLAIHVEDHPIEYLHFEGVIPKGEYGGGTVLVWDTGTWAPVNDNGYESGDFKFVLDGEKLQGGWMLVHTGKRKGTKQWLLFKERDPSTRNASEFDVLKECPASVLTGRTLEQVTKDADTVWSSKDSARTKVNSRRTQTTTGTRDSETSGRNGAVIDPNSIAGSRKRVMPKELAPMLPTATKEAPVGDRWVHEIKYDGYRMIAHICDGQAKLVSRNGHDWSAKLPKLCDELSRFPAQPAIIDGEVVSLTEQGTSNFQELQNTIGKGRDAQLSFYAFDLLYLSNYDLTGCNLVDRKLALATFLPNDRLPSIRYSEHIEGDGPIVFQQASRLGTEGIVSKLAGGRYVEGRSRDWLKTKAFQSAEFVLTGYTESNAKQPFGSLIVGAYDGNGDLVYVGRVGTGFNSRSMAALAEEMRRLEIDQSALINASDCVSDQAAHWIEPQIAVEVEYASLTRKNILRHPSFRGIREDVAIDDIRLETLPSFFPQSELDQEEPASKKQRTTKISVTVASAPEDVPVGDLSKIQMTNPERLMYPDAGVTKLGIATHYAQVAARMLPHVVNRPLALVRCPKGVGEKCFFQKSRAKGMPESLQEVVVVMDGKNPQKAIVVRDFVGVVSLVQFSALEVHTWCCRMDRPDRPDKIIFDLDPDESLGFGRVATAAILLRELLWELELESFVKTTGGKGLHVVLPIARTLEWDDASGFALNIGKQMVARSPGRFTTNMSKTARRGKIYVDYLRNKFGATAIAPYSTRSKANASVATPLAWEEVESISDAAVFTVVNFPRRLETQKVDPWSDLLQAKQTITKAMLRAVSP